MNKLKILRSFAGNRFDLKGDEFSRTLNEISVVFADSPRVKEKLLKFHSKIVSCENSENELIELFRAICDDIKLPHQDLDDSLFLRPFNTRPSSSSKGHSTPKQ